MASSYFGNITNAAALLTEQQMIEHERRMKRHMEFSRRYSSTASSILSPYDEQDWVTSGVVRPNAVLTRKVVSAPLYTPAPVKVMPGTSYTVTGGGGGGSSTNTTNKYPPSSTKHEYNRPTDKIIQKTTDALKPKEIGTLFDDIS
jgi:hypothetical protein